MESEGPYKIDTYQASEPWKRLIAVGPSICFGKDGIPPNCGEMVDLLNTAYAEGQKAGREKLHREIMGDTNAK